MWLFDNRAVPDLRTPLPGPAASALLEHDSAICRRHTRAYIRWLRPRQRRGHRGCRWQSFLGLHCRDRGHQHGPLPSGSRRRHPGSGEQTNPHVWDGFLLPAANRSGAAFVRTAPGPSPKRVFFTNSGAEALEAGLKLARWHTGRSRALAFFGAFHGRTYGAMSLSGSKLVHRRGFSPLVPDIHHVPFPRGCQGCMAAGECLHLRAQHRGNGPYPNRPARRDRGYLRGTHPRRGGLPCAAGRLLARAA